MPMIRPPKRAPLTRPRPPKRLTPPITAAEDDDEEDDQLDEGNAPRLVAAPDGRKGEAAEEDDPRHGQDRIPGRQPGTAAAEPGAEARSGKADGEDDGDRPAGVLRQHVVGDVVDLLVLDPDHALRPEVLQDHALPDEQPREGDDERGNADDGHDRPLEGADRGADADRAGDRD